MDLHLGKQSVGYWDESLPKLRAHHASLTRTGSPSLAPFSNLCRLDHIEQMLADAHGWSWMLVDDHWWSWMIMDHDATSTLYTTHLWSYHFFREVVFLNGGCVENLNGGCAEKLSSLAKFLEKLPPGSSVKSSTQNSSPTRRQAEGAFETALITAQQKATSITSIDHISRAVGGRPQPPRIRIASPKCLSWCVPMAKS